MAKQDVQLAIMDAELDDALALAKKSPQQGVEAVIGMLNRANSAKLAVSIQNIMDGATKRGFNCEFWPGEGGISIRVRYDAPEA